jgi:hypothetical protein
MGQPGVTVHDFQECLRKSEAQTDAPWWGQVYRSAFPGFANMVCVRKDGWAQRGGIDRVVTLSSGKSLWVDEKIREKDWPDILLEAWSDAGRRDLGWAAKPLACDFIAYAFVPSRTCHLLPVLPLQRAFKQHGKHWHEVYGYVRAHNHCEGRTWTTLSVPVPIDELYLALTCALQVRWSVVAA